jgi:hypothetical protein
MPRPAKKATSKKSRSRLSETPDIPREAPVQKVPAADTDAQNGQETPPAQDSRGLQHRVEGDIPSLPPIKVTGHLSLTTMIMVVVAFIFLIVLTVALILGHISEGLYVSITMSVFALLYAIVNRSGGR